MSAIAKKHGNTVATLKVSTQIDRVRRDAKLTPVKAALNSLAAVALIGMAEGAALLDYRTFIVAVKNGDPKVVEATYRAQFEKAGRGGQTYMVRQTRYRLAAVLFAMTGELPGDSKRHDVAYTELIAGTGSKAKVEAWSENLNAGRKHDEPAENAVLEAGEVDPDPESTDEGNVPESADSESLSVQLVKVAALLAQSVVKGWTPDADEAASIRTALDAVNDALESVGA